ncbi:unnamed protein product [Thlaspi arvense]|uniref:Uncharacterized protein n=1 Tax=Thlaspi arvense TaxID=13288 RepID=A0AAU9SM07_THLAR|nr:unnamed protein product [Thlaspi arvense]
MAHTSCTDKPLEALSHSCKGQAMQIIEWPPRGKAWSKHVKHLSAVLVDIPATCHVMGISRPDYVNQVWIIMRSLLKVKSTQEKHTLPLLAPSYTEMNSNTFNLWEVLEVIKNQAMILSQERQVQIIYDSPSEVSSMYLYGDNLRLQQVLADFLVNALIFTPGFEGASVLFRLIPRRERIGTKMHIMHLEFW